MKYICLGDIEPGTFEGMTEDERHAMFDECFEYNDRLRANGHVATEVPLQPPETAVTLYWKNGKVLTTDPFANVASGNSSEILIRCSLSLLAAGFEEAVFKRTP